MEAAIFSNPIQWIRNSKNHQFWSWNSQAKVTWSLCKSFQQQFHFRRMVCSSTHWNKLYLSAKLLNELHHLYRTKMLLSVLFVNPQYVFPHAILSEAQTRSYNVIYVIFCWVRTPSINYISSFLRSCKVNGFDIYNERIVIKCSLLKM